MKRILFLFFIFIALTVTGCSSSSVEEKDDNSSETKQMESSKESETEKAEEKEKQVENGGEESTKTVPENKNEPQEKNEEIQIKEPIYKLNPKTYSVQPIADANKKVVLLTIDDAPDTYAVEMAKTLKKLDVKAIFFVNGHFIDSGEEKERLKLIHEMGFEIGNHTWNHKKLPSLTPEEQKKEIVALNDEIEKVIGERPKFFRAPFGMNSEVSRKVVADEKMLLMNWSFGYDFMEDYMTKESLTGIMLNTELLHNGTNILMHDRKWTNAALEDIVQGIRKKGFEFVDPTLIQTP